jgi:uncharacterized membrane protein
MVNEKPSVLPGLLFGLGLGGFVDGIVLHEILQWHHMITGAESSNTLSGLELNVVPTVSSTSSRRCWSWPVPL